VQVKELWRYPVKSLQGERVDSSEVGSAGLQGDRRYAIFDAETGLGLSARRVPELLFGRASIAVDGSVSIHLPDGSLAPDDAALSRWLGRRVVLRSTDEVPREASARQFENVVDFEHEDSSEWYPFEAAMGAFQDTAAAAVTLLSEETLGTWPQRRFRPNIVLSGGGEDDLVGRRVAIGQARLDVTKTIGRCVMVTRPQPAPAEALAHGVDSATPDTPIEKDLDVLRTIHRERGGKLAVGALIAVAGLVSVGDEVVET
jgi:uncharacterized protein